MGAAVLEHVDRTGGIARHHHGRRPHEGAAERAWFRQLGLERHEIPRGSMENPRDLALIDLGAGVDPVRNPREALHGPGEGKCGIGVRRRRAIGHRAISSHTRLYAAAAALANWLSAGNWV